jgi:PTS system nitrogen regulatory IIA component
MDVNFRLRPEAIDIVSASNKAQILETVADRFAAVYGVDRTEVLESLEEREALGSTGFGRGVAIPHARSESVNRPVAVLLKLEHAADFGSADGMDVDLVFGLLSPVNAGVGHLHALAAISRLVRDEATHQALTEAQSAEAIYAHLSNASDRDVA